VSTEPDRGRRRPPGLFGGEPRSLSSEERVSVLKFLGPRYWRVWLFVFWLRLIVFLPWRQSIAMHRLFGRIAGTRSGRRIRGVRDSIGRCFPSLTPEQRDALTTEFAANVGASIAEIGFAWFASRQRLRSLVKVEGAENLRQALADGKGVILVTGHFTPLEICSAMIKDSVPSYTLVYNKRRNRLLSEIQRRRRSRYADEAYAKGNIRQIIRSLQNNGTVLFAADEAFTDNSSLPATLFGQEILMNSATIRLARITGAAAVPVYYQRRTDESGYRVKFAPALSDFPGDDQAADIRRLAALLEQSIRRCPEQYFWSQKRFR
jgi:KDO2-lipid IV(A) lauroyltransferase